MKTTKEQGQQLIEAVRTLEQWNENMGSVPWMAAWTFPYNNQRYIVLIEEHHDFEDRTFYHFDDGVWCRVPDELDDELREWDDEHILLELKATKWLITKEVRPLVIETPGGVVSIDHEEDTAEWLKYSEVYGESTREVVADAYQ